MNRQEFEQKNSAEWQAFEVELKSVDKNEDLSSAASIPSKFRKICYDLSLAQYRMFGARICDRLNSLAIQGYRSIHRSKGAFGEGFLIFFLRTFPQAFRRDWKLFVVSSFIFWVPFFLMWWSAHREIAWIQSLLGPESMNSLEGMYGKNANTVEHLRQEHGSNFEMFAHYIQNNVGIDFQLYGGGILFGLGTIFYLFFNGLHIGATVGYINYAGDPEKLWRFVAGHSSFELLGMIVVGMAGLKLGFSLLAPGNYPRGKALARAGRCSLPLLLGGASMTTFAAVIEGFWSAQPITASTKYFAGIIFWVLHLLYFTVVGRRGYGA
ncbi:MAG: stage II sporulation protein M [Akkermansiaceae bacterium]|nr:stage II sporulation protein M [Akkermansiaceae bacterium]